MTISGQPVFTVGVATYNHACVLPRLYESLRSQTFRDFEFVIVDDGSTDDTEALVQSWVAKADFPVRYFRQPNSGRHVAINRGVQEACGAFYHDVNADDALVPQTLERFLHHWERIADDKRPSFAGVGALCTTFSGQLVGTEFPTTPFDSDPMRANMLFGVRGDKTWFIRTEVMREFPFPVIPGERYMPPHVAWWRIARHYRFRFVNEVLRIKDYLPGGVTRSRPRTIVTSPLGYRLMIMEDMHPPFRLGLLKRAQQHAHYVRFSLHARVSVGQMVHEAPSLPLLCVGVPKGIWFWTCDRWLARQQVVAGEADNTRQP